VNRRAIEIESDEDSRPRPKTALARFERALGDRAVAEQWVSVDEIREAAARARKHGIRLSTALYELGLIDEARLRSVGAELLRTRPVLSDDVVSGARALGSVFGAEELIELRVVPFARKGEKLWIATSEPWRLSLLDDLASRIGCRAEVLFLDEGPLALCLEALFEHPADPRFKEPPRRRRRQTAAGAAGGPASEPEPEGDLMSESAFDDLYQQ